MGHRNLRVFTNNISVAIAASHNHSFQVTIAGGRLRNTDLDVLGPSAEEFFSAYKVDFGVFGVGGVDHDGSLLDFTEDEVRVRQVICGNCRQSLLVLDRTKFGSVAHVRGGSIDQMTAVFCDRNPPATIQTMIRDSHTNLFVSEGAIA
jgi:DeoR family glycerol-3-phosphate regulon repressor